MCENKCVADTTHLPYPSHVVHNKEYLYVTCMSHVFGELKACFAEECTTTSRLLSQYSDLVVVHS